MVRQTLSVCNAQSSPKYLQLLCHNFHIHSLSVTFTIRTVPWGLPRARSVALAVERGLCRVCDGGERLVVETDHSVGAEGLTGVE